MSVVVRRDRNTSASRRVASSSVVGPSHAVAKLIPADQPTDRPTVFASFHVDVWTCGRVPRGVAR